MSNYDFTQLSDVEFEDLVRDLLQVELGCALESFESGRDQGIDLRYAQNSANTIIIQCKHYAGSGWNSLKSHMKTKEMPKVKRLPPCRYVLATSVGLSVQKVDMLSELMQPFCRSTADIYGKRRLNQILGDNPNIEEKHFKLWMSSLAVVRKIIGCRVITHSEFEISDIRSRIKRYVQTQSFHDAKLILEKSNVCIIAGDPGIGKTTLAELLVIDYLNRGFDPVSLTSLDEVKEAFNPYAKQIFYFDDFLGSISLEVDFAAHTDQSILNFIKKIRSYGNKRLILTTREYILAKAEILSEKLNQSQLSSKTYTLDLKKYSKLDQAKILYNHVFYSEIPIAHKLALLEQNRYMKIINHPNYNPRVIEWMTDVIEVGDLDSEKYVEVFLSNLNNPAKLWDHCIRKQLNDSERNLLMVLFTAGNYVFLSDLRLAFESFQLTYSEHYNTSFSPQSFGDAIRRLQSNFIVIQRDNKGEVVSFKNASIQDFFARFLEENPTLLDLLIVSATYFSQLCTIWRFILRDNNVLALSVDLLNQLLSRIEIVLWKEDWSLATFRGEGNVLYKDRYSPLDSRVSEVIRLAKPSDANISHLNEFVRIQAQRFADEPAGSKRYAAQTLLAALEFTNFAFVDNRSSVLFSLRAHILSSPSWLDDFDSALDFLLNYPEICCAEDFPRIRVAFQEYCKDPYFGHLKDLDAVEEYRSQLVRIGVKLEVETVMALKCLERRATEIAAAQSVSVMDEPHLNAAEDEDSELIQKRIHSMFESLR